jgi:hypothetical protein
VRIVKNENILELKPSFCEVMKVIFSIAEGLKTPVPVEL